MVISVKSKDSTFTDTLISKYLDYLNYYIKTTVQAEAKENVSYLDNQLISIADPLLREKLQNMIASEMEKAMIVSKEAYKLIDPALRNRIFKIKKVYPLVFGFGLSIITILAILFGYILSTGEKTDEDKMYLLAIRKSIGLKN